jgi:hypothetical protein
VTRVWTLPELRKQLSRKQRVAVFMKTDGRCYQCSQKLETKGWDAEHPQALELLGPSDIDALLPICKPCHKIKTADDRKAIAKCNRVRDKHIGAMPKKGRPLPGTKASGFRKRMDGTVERR